jgi:hypothetical protein
MSLGVHECMAKLALSLDGHEELLFFTTTGANSCHRKLVPIAMKNTSFPWPCFFFRILQNSYWRNGQAWTWLHKKVRQSSSLVSFYYYFKINSRKPWCENLSLMRSQLLEGFKCESQTKKQWKSKESGHAPWLATLWRGRGACSHRPAQNQHKVVSA